MWLRWAGRRILDLHICPVSKQLEKKLAKFATERGESVPPTGRVSGEQSCVLVPQIFRGNAVQDASGRVVLPVLGSLAAHGCHPNLLRVIGSPKEGRCEFLATTKIEVCFDTFL
jgi:hypothetical protein